MFGSTVKCEECKCHLYRHDAQVVNYRGDDIYYCQTHKKPYEKVMYRYWMSDIKYYKEMEVNEKGEPVGYKKVKSLT